MIKLIDVCENFEKIFPGINNLSVESALFNFFTNLSKVEPNLVGDAINNKIDTIDSYDINNDAKLEVKQILVNIDSSKFSQISKFICELKDLTSIGCVPQHFVQFAKKATIFASSAFDQISLSLPGRKYNISILEDSRIRVFGSIFSSIFIESLLNEKSQSSLTNFKKSICDLFQSYKDQFIDCIITQNQYIKAKTMNTSLPKKDQIISFFQANPLDKSHFYNNSNNWPNLSSMMLEKNIGMLIYLMLISMNIKMYIFVCSKKLTPNHQFIIQTSMDLLKVNILWTSS